MGEVLSEKGWCTHREQGKRVQGRKEKKKKTNPFHSYTPLSERLVKEVRILTIAETHGATKAFSSLAWEGIGALLEEAQREGKPYDLLIINGGLIPDMGTYTTKSVRKRAKLITDGVESITDARDVMRRAVKQLVPFIGTTPVIYIFGEEDDANIQSLMDLFIDETNSRAGIEQKIQKLTADIEGIRLRLQSIDTEIRDVLEPRLNRSHEQRLEALRELRNDEHSTSVKREYAERLRSLEQLIQEDAKAIQRRIAKANELRNRMEDKQHLITLLTEELRHLGAVQRTNVHTLTPSESRAIEARAREEYTAIIRRIFEGVEHLHIVMNNVEMYEIHGLRLSLAHRFENTSVMSKPNHLGFIEPVTFKLQQNKFIQWSDIVVFTHHPGTKVWAVPVDYAHDHPQYIFQQGSLANPNGIYAVWNEKVKTPQTEALHRHAFDSGVTEITVKKDGSVTFTHVSHGMLEEYARPQREEERKNLIERLEKPDALKRLKTMVQENGEEESKEKQLALLRLEKPSTLSESELSLLVQETAEKTVQGIVRKIVSVPRRRTFLETTLHLISDVHMGSGNYPIDHSVPELLEAVIKDSKTQKPSVIVFGGDMVEGALELVANEWLSRNVLNYENFERILQRELEAKRITAREAERAREEFHKRSNLAHTIPNVDIQFSMLRPLFEYAAEIVEGGGHLITISGNHYNKTHKHNRFDEATRLAHYVRLIGGFEENHPRIHVFMGGKRGSGFVTINGIPMFGMHGTPFAGSRDIVTAWLNFRLRQRRPSVIDVTGHWHDPVWAKTLDAGIISIPSLAPLKAHLDEIGAHGGLRGYTRALIVVEKDTLLLEKLQIELRLYPQLAPYLPPIDPLFINIFQELVKKDKKS